MCNKSHRSVVFLNLLKEEKKTRAESLLSLAYLPFQILIRSPLVFSPTKPTHSRLAHRLPPRAAAMELATATAAAAASSTTRAHRPRSSRLAVPTRDSCSLLPSSSSRQFAALSTSAASTASRSRAQRRRLPVASAAVELREASSQGGDSVRVTETLQPGSSVSSSSSPRLSPPRLSNRSQSLV